MLDLAARAAATEAVVGKYRHRAFDWNSRATCVHLARAQMRALGHRPPSVPDFRSPRGALTALRKAGFDTFEDLLGSMLMRVAPLAMIVGDIGLLPGEPPFQSAVIAAGGGKVFGWHDGDLSRLHPISVSVLDFEACFAVGR